MDNDKFLTVDELSSYIKIPKPTIYMLLSKRRIPGAKVGKQWRFNKDSIDKWMEEKEHSFMEQKNRRKTDIIIQE